MTRLISGAILAGAAMAAIRFLPVTALRWVAAVVAVLAAHEYVRVAGSATGASRFIQAAAVVAACVLMSTGFGVDPTLLQRARGRLFVGDHDREKQRADAVRQFLEHAHDTRVQLRIEEPVILYAPAADVLEVEPIEQARRHA